MPTQTQRFTTPQPIAVDIRNPRGAIEVLASDTGLTSVDITSRFDDLDADVRFDEGTATLFVEIPRRRFGKQPRVTVTVRVPNGFPAHRRRRVREHHRDRAHGGARAVIGQRQHQGRGGARVP